MNFEGAVEEGGRRARGNAAGLKAAGYQDDPSRGDKEELRLELELVPGWAPGRSMKPPQPAVMTLAPFEAAGEVPETKK